MQCRLGRVRRRNGNADVGILQKTGNADDDDDEVNDDDDSNYTEDDYAELMAMI